MKVIDVISQESATTVEESQWDEWMEHSENGEVKE